jgi:tetratricopeptide (TPR) repeat protein
MLNYLAQFYSAIGSFAKAEELLLESLTYFDPGLRSAWQGYNQALLGKVYLEWGRVSDAVEALQRGWEDTQATWNVDLVQLVRNYYAELLMVPGHQAYDPTEAEQLLQATLSDSRKAAVHTAEITALSLLARLSLLQGQTADASRSSKQAVDLLLAKGPLPALRAEEVHFTHARAMEAAGHGAEAREALGRAYQTLRDKAQSIDDDQRDSYFKNVSLSREILAAWPS